MAVSAMTAWRYTLPHPPRRLKNSGGTTGTTELPRASIKARLFLPLAFVWSLSFYAIFSLSASRYDEVEGGGDRANLDLSLQPDSVAVVIGGLSSSNATPGVGRQLRLVDIDERQVRPRHKGNSATKKHGQSKSSLHEDDIPNEVEILVEYRPDLTKPREESEPNEEATRMYHKWTDSSIWPCVNVEQRRPNPPNGSHSTIRVLHLHNWTLHVVKDSQSQTYTTSMLDVLQTAKNSFGRSLERAIPSVAKSSEYPIHPDKHDIAVLAGIRIQIDNVTSRLYPSMDESYRIYIPCPSGDAAATNDVWIHLHAVTVYGARHGLETIKQVLQFAWLEDEQDNRGTATTTAAAFTLRNNVTYIEDGPVYSYRGLMIDTARHFLPLNLVLHNLFVMASNKLNVLHWHMTDSESWPYQSTTFPELSQQGAYCKECVYSRDDVESVIAQAALLGIRVIAEFDLPGHSQVIGRSHPELMSVDSKGKPSEPLDVTLPAVHEFVNALYLEIADVFSDDWMHIGGDEVSLDHWNDSVEIKEWMAEHNVSTDVELWQYFEMDAISIVETSLQKRAIVWQDSFEAGAVLPQSTILDVWQLWIMEQSVHNATTAGYDIVFSACWYLDHLDRDWWAFYVCDPREFILVTTAGIVRLTDEQRSRVLGGHSAMWGETVDATNFFERVWPRASATAEVLWAGGVIDVETTHDEVQSRLDHFRCWMVQQFDIPAAPISPGHCEMRPVEYPTMTRPFSEALARPS